MSLFTQMACRALGEAHVEKEPHHGAFVGI
jgi:hypothetical protein